MKLSHVLPLVFIAAVLDSPFFTLPVLCCAGGRFVLWLLTVAGEGGVL